MFAKNRFWIGYFLVLALATMFAASAFAEPVIFESVDAPTFNQPASGTPDGYRLYQGCDEASQTTGTLIDGAYTSGKAYSFAGDTDTPPTLCIVAYNATGKGPFDMTWTLDDIEPAPGAVEVIIPGTCRAIVDGVERGCTITIN